MEHHRDQVHATEVEASGGSKEGVVRWVLLIGTLLAVLALGAVWMTGAAVQDEGADSETSVDAPVQPTAASETDVGEPIAPSIEESATPSAATQADAGEPGDAPAGDPTNTAQ